MTDKKLTDEEIISSLELIATTGNCNECKIRNCKWGTCNCTQITANAALELINRQKSEIEELKNYVNRCKSGKEYWVKCLLEKPNEAIKEFADKLEEKCGIFTPLGVNWIEETKVVKVSDIDKILKEMVGEEE